MIGYKAMAKRDLNIIALSPVVLNPGKYFVKPMGSNKIRLKRLGK